MPVDVCPSAEEFRRLLSGQLADADVEAIARHLEGCTQCPQTLQGLGDDTLVRALRTGAGKLVAEPARVERIIASCLAGKKASGQPDTNADPDTLPPSEESASEGIDLSFLGLPQQGDEIGRLGGYRVLRLLGAGGMGMVLAAEDVKLGRPVALKVMRPELAAMPTAKDRFLREAKAAAALTHDHIVTIYQVGEDNGVPFIALQFLEGESLADRLHRERLPESEIIRIGKEMAAGLAAAHNRGLIHRDIKPANIWLEFSRDAESSERSAGRVKILDFGVARMSGDKGQLTQTGAILGTPAYMAPEQARGKLVDARADLFSLGCVLYEMSTGQRPFKGDDAISILSSLALDEATPPHELNPQISLALSALIQQLLAKEPDKRPQCAADVVKALSTLQAPMGSGATSINPWKDIDLSGPTEFVAEKSYIKTKSKAPLPFRTRLQIGVAIAVAMFVLVGGALAGVLLFKTKNGTLVVQVDGDAEVRFKNEKLQILDETGKVVKYELEPSERNKSLPPGKYMIRVTGPDGLKLDTDRFEMTRKGAEVRVSVDQAVVAGKDNFNGFTNNVGMKFALVPKGKAWLGGGGGVHGTREVECRQDYYLGIYTVTQEQWLKLMADNPSAYSRRGARENAVKDFFDDELRRFPVESANYAMILEFLAKLNERDKQAGWTYRLPTCDEWEYACRGGPMIDRGDSAYSYYFDQPTNVAPHGKANIAGNGLNRTCPVGTNTPNKLGLYDMHGNVLEWCADKISKDGVEIHLACGSSWNDPPFNAASRLQFSNEKRYPSLGFRVARVPAGKEVIMPVSSADPDRCAAEWVLSIGGKVTVRMAEQEREVAELKDLPPDPFQVIAIETVANGKMNDQGLVLFKPLKSLSKLNLPDAQISNTGLKNLVALPQLTMLYLAGATIDDAGLEYLGQLTHLDYLNLGYVPISNTGLARLKSLTDLKQLFLAGVPIDDEGLVHLKALVNLEVLMLSATKVRGPGLKHLKSLPRLNVLYISGIPIGEPAMLQIGGITSLQGLEVKSTQVGDDALKHVKTMPNLRGLDLYGTPVSDAGLEHLKGTKLVNIDLTNTKVTPAGADALRKALWNCNVVMETTADRRAADWVLSLGGTVQINNAAEIYKSASQLPNSKFTLTSVELGGNKMLTDADLIRLKDCTNLWVLDLHATAIGDAGLAHLKDQKKLTYVQFGDTQITDAGLAYLKNCKDLAHLNLYSTRVGDDGMANFQGFRKITHLDLSTTEITDKGLAYFKDCKKLERLALQSTDVTDVGLAYFKDCKHLDHLNLSMTGVTDTGLAYFKDCKLLTELKLQKTKVSAAAIEAFAKDMPQCRIILDGRTIEPKK